MELRGILDLLGAPLLKVVKCRPVFGSARLYFLDRAIWLAQFYKLRRNCAMFC